MCGGGRGALPYLLLYYLYKGHTTMRGDVHAILLCCPRREGERKRRYIGIMIFSLIPRRAFWITL